MDGCSSVSSRLKTAIMKRLRLVFLSLKLYKLRLEKHADDVGVSAYKTRRTRSFNAGRRGLCGFFDDSDDDDDDDESYFGVTKRLHRTRSSTYYDRDSSGDYDVDQRAEIFISNFRSRLLMEREISLKLRYREKEEL